MLEDSASSFYSNKTPIHKLDPRIKLFAALLLSIVIALSGNFNSMVAGLITTLGLVVLVRLKISVVMKRLVFVNFFTLLVWLFVPFTTPGEELFSLYGFSASIQGVRVALAITLKTNAIVLINMVLLTSSSLVDLVHAMHHLKMPDKAIYLFSFVVRYMDITINEYQRLKTAMKVRGFKPSTNLHTYRSYAYLIAMVLIRSIERAERIYKAMLCRGFTGTFYTLDHFHLKRYDFVVLFAFIMLSCMIILAAFIRI